MRSTLDDICSFRDVRLGLALLNRPIPSSFHLPSPEEPLRYLRLGRITNGIPRRNINNLRSNIERLVEDDSGRTRMINISITNPFIKQFHWDERSKQLYNHGSVEISIHNNESLGVY